MTDSVERLAIATPTNGRTDERTKTRDQTQPSVTFCDARARIPKALAFLIDDPFLPAREAATRWDLARYDEVQAFEQADLEYLWRNQASVCRPLFELIPDMADHHYVAGFGCSVCEPRR